MEQTHSFWKMIAIYLLGIIIFISASFQLVVKDFLPMHQDSKTFAILLLVGWILLLVFSFIISRILIKSSRYKALRIILIVGILIVFGMEMYAVFGTPICGVAGCETNQIELPPVIY